MLRLRELALCLMWPLSERSLPCRSSTTLLLQGPRLIQSCSPQFWMAWKLGHTQRGCSKPSPPSAVYDGPCHDMLRWGRLLSSAWCSLPLTYHCKHPRSTCNSLSLQALCRVKSHSSDHALHNPGWLRSRGVRKQAAVGHLHHSPVLERGIPSAGCRHALPCSRLLLTLRCNEAPCISALGSGLSHVLRSRPARTTAAVNCTIHKDASVGCLCMESS